MDIGTLQRLSGQTWPGLEQGRLGEWELRAAEGFTARANSALPIGDPGVPNAEAIDRVGRWYAARGLPARFQVPATLDGSLGPADELDRWCDSNGWGAEPWTLVMARDARPLGLAAVLDVDLTEQPDEAWLNLYHYRGAELPEAARRVITAAPARYLTGRVDGEVVGIGRVAVAGSIAVLTAIEVAGDHRRKGYGLAITEALAGAGVDLGATLTVLQVFAHNEPAVRLYHRLGFTDHHRYRYRTPKRSPD